MYGWLWHASSSLLKSLRPIIHLIIFSNDFGDCIRHLAVVQLTLDLDVLLLLRYDTTPRVLFGSA